MFPLGASLAAIGLAFVSLMVFGESTARVAHRQETSTNATCEDGYDWANNDAGITPCVLAAVLISCNTDDHTIPPLNDGNHYNPPSLKNQTVNVCRCSWALYNLMSMCTACQGQESSLNTWASYSVECKGFLQSDSFYPSTITLPVNATIPSWAGPNPTKWTNGVFNVTEAEQIVVSPTDSSILNSPDQSANAKPTAAIIGGSIGGAILLILCSAAGVWYFCQKRRRLGQDYRWSTYRPLISPSTSPGSDSTVYHRITGSGSSQPDYFALDSSQAMGSDPSRGSRTWSRPGRATAEALNGSVEPFTLKHELEPQTVRHSLQRAAHMDRQNFFSAGVTHPGLPVHIGMATDSPPGTGHGEHALGRPNLLFSAPDAAGSVRAHGAASGARVGSGKVSHGEEAGTMGGVRRGSSPPPYSSSTVA